MWGKVTKPRCKTSAELKPPSVTVRELSPVPSSSHKQPATFPLPVTHCVPSRRSGTDPPPEPGFGSITEATASLQALWSCTNWGQSQNHPLALAARAAFQSLAQSLLSPAWEHNCKLEMTEKGVQTLRNHLHAGSTWEWFRRCCLCGFFFYLIEEPGSPWPLSWLCFLWLALWET